jgi:diacylglycerol kinase (ATP)
MPNTPPPKRKITVIINPASGLRRDAEQVIRTFLADYADRLEATIHLTEASGDATRFARAAAEAGAEVVAAYGGDGTMMEAAVGVMQTPTPLLMLPGGTANVMALDLSVPTTLEDALTLALAPDLTLRSVDMGELDGTHFLLRVGIGYEAEMSARTARGDKSKKGRMAYIERGLALLRRLRYTSYVLTIDGQKHVRRGVTCLICNSTHIGVPNLRLTHNSDVSDGVLDVFVLRDFAPGTLLKTLFHILRSLLHRTKPTGSVHIDHWQGKHITVQMRRRQFVGRDGEPLKRSKRVTAQVLPSALRVVVPSYALPSGGRS